MGIRRASVRSLFLDNTTVKQTVFKNTFWLGTAEATSRLLKLVLMIYVARILGATEYGRFSFALAFVSLFYIFHDFGLPLVVTREFSAEKGTEGDFHSVLSLKVLLSIGVSIAILIGSTFVTPDTSVRTTMGILATFSLTSGFLTIVYAFFQARQRMEYQSWAIILQACVVTPVGILVLLKAPSSRNLGYSYLLSTLVALAFALTVLHFKVSPLKLEWRPVVWRRFMEMSWPMAMIGLSGILYTYLDSALLGYWGFVEETGWYNAAYSIIHVVLLPAGLIATSVYPISSKFFKDSEDKFQGTLQVQINVMILLAVPLVTGGIALAPRIIGVLYGPEYLASVPALQILLLIVVFVFVGTPLQYGFFAAAKQMTMLYVTTAGAVVNILLNVLLIPRFTLYGAAAATLATYALMFALQLFAVRQITRISILNKEMAWVIVHAVLSTGIMYLVISQERVYNLNPAVAILVGASTYFAAFSVLRRTAG